MASAGPAAAVVVTEVGWIENQGVPMRKIARLEVVVVEMPVSALDAVKGGKSIPITLDNNE